MVSNENEGPNHVVYRSSVTGNFVSKAFADAHPRTTYKDTVPDNPTEIEIKDSEESEADHEREVEANSEDTPHA